MPVQFPLAIPPRRVLAGRRRWSRMPVNMSIRGDSPCNILRCNSNGMGRNAQEEEEEEKVERKGELIGAEFKDRSINRRAGWSGVVHPNGWWVLIGKEGFILGVSFCGWIAGEGKADLMELEVTTS